MLESLKEFTKFLMLLIKLLYAINNAPLGKTILVGTGEWFSNPQREDNCRKCVNPVRYGNKRAEINIKDDGSLDLIAFDGTFRGMTEAIKLFKEKDCSLLMSWELEISYW